MFKKPFTLKNQSKVRSSDQRQLWQQIVAAYGNAWAIAGAAQVADHSISHSSGIATEIPADLAPLTQEPTQTQLMALALSEQPAAARFITHVDDKGTLYFGDGKDPLWFQTLLDKPPPMVIPTMYTLWQFPTMLPVIQTHPPVLGHLVSGADLMLPGIVVPADGLPTFTAGQVVAIATTASPLPIAVGYALLPSTDMAKAAGTAKGKAVSVLHTYKDYLWQHGCQKPYPRLPPTELSVPPSSTSRDTTPKPITADPVPELSPAEVDDCLYRCLLQALSTTLDAKALKPLLPLSASTLYSSYMLPCRAAHLPSLDVKKSTYKKLSKFFKSVDKRGLMKTKELKGGDLLILGVDWSHADLADFEPMAKNKLAMGSRANAVAGTTGPPTASAPVGKRPPLQITMLCKPKPSLAEFLRHHAAEAKPYYTRAEIRDTILAYVCDHRLQDRARPKMVNFDEPLADAILPPEERLYPPVLTYPKLVERAMAQTQPYHCVAFSSNGTDDNGHDSSEVRMGLPQAIRITVEQKMGRKYVTTISGLEAYRINPTNFYKRLQHACAASGAVNPLRGKAKGVPLQEVEIQGQQEKKVTQLLLDDGIPNSLCMVVNKVKGKKPGK
ncbi:hypothetical protein H4R34_004946 [Dimargaris verticillata]|uniref:SUI1 domain-containing protein n=1 Tax=Dimargaris verticillata TaxID=2761393 RepID=A0A9W8EAP5_9FUNG|nr:hypothetical protein H4R34_004946 [Dimargaris verticillata]